MSRKRFKKIWTLLRLYLVMRELKKLSRKRAPIGPTFPIAALMLLLSGCAPSAPADDPVVVILRDGLPTCSGFAVAKNQILTAAHCVSDRSDVAFVTADQWKHTANAFAIAHVQYVDPRRDIAGLSSEFNFAKFVNFREPREGEFIYARSVFFGAVTDGSVLPGAGYFRDTDMTIARGWSGSPVFGVDGKVVGFVHSCEALEGKCLPFSAQIGVLP